MWNAPTARPEHEADGKDPQVGQDGPNGLEDGAETRWPATYSQVLDMAKRSSHSDMAIMKM